MLSIEDLSDEKQGAVLRIYITTQKSYIWVEKFILFETTGPDAFSLRGSAERKPTNTVAPPRETADRFKLSQSFYSQRFFGVFLPRES